MKVVALYFDDAVDLSSFSAEEEVSLSNMDNTVEVTGKLLTDPFRTANLPVGYHEHPAESTTTTTIGPPVTS